ncbi:MAG TPA: MarR family winged helix-turn-helix transcriptional regulator [Streptosporangiaceae bacterium]
MAAYAVDERAVEAVLGVGQALIALATRSLEAPAVGITVLQYRALVVLASGGPRRMVDLSDALGVVPSAAGRMCDRLVHKTLVARHRSQADRREVLVSVTAAGRDVVERAAADQRLLVCGVLGQLPPGRQAAVGAALREFAAAAGEVPAEPWPPGSSGGGHGGRARDGARGNGAGAEER